MGLSTRLNTIVIPLKKRGKYQGTTGAWKAFTLEPGTTFPIKVQQFSALPQICWALTNASLTSSTPIVRHKTTAEQIPLNTHN